MQYMNTITAPLPAGGVLTDSRQTDPDFPYLCIQVSADVAGTIIVSEWEQVTGSDSTTNLVAQIPVAAGAALASFCCRLSQAFYKITYQNGATAQATFNFSYGSSSQAIETDQRIQVLILRELRAISLLLSDLKAPSGTVVNVPFGTDVVSPM